MTKSITHWRGYPWLVISLCAAFLFYKYILQVSPSIMTQDLMRVFHVNGAGLGNLAATFFYTYILMQLCVGVLLDKYSPRLLTSIAIGLCALGAYGFSQADHLSIAQLTRALMGIGVAFATVAYMKMTAVWFNPEQAAFVGGLLATAAMLGAVFGQAPLAWLVSHLGWRDSLHYCAILGLIIAVLFYVFVRDNHDKKTPEHSIRLAFNWKDFWKVLRNKQNWLLTLYGGLAFEPLAVFGGLWGNPYLEQSYQLSATEAASIVSMAFIGCAVGSPALGLLSDRLGNRRTVMFWGTGLSFISLSIAIYAPLNAGLLALFMFLFGFGTGAFMLVFALGRDSNPLILAASVAAMINTGEGILSAAAEPFLGKLLDLTWTGTIKDGVHIFSTQDYRLAFIFLPLCLLSALFTLLFIRQRNVQF